jgi:hypothetical protein
MVRPLSWLLLSLLAGAPAPAAAAGSGGLPEGDPLRADLLLFGAPGEGTPAGGHDLARWILEPAPTDTPPHAERVELFEDAVQAAGDPPAPATLWPGAHAPQALPD